MPELSGAAALDVLLDHHRDVIVDVAATSSGHVVLARIVVPDDRRRRGLGSAVMRDLCDWADQNGRTLALTPATDFGGTKAGLLRFYKRFGFVTNRGPTRDLSVSETMLRFPRDHTADYR